ncbi:hypothetical protein O181_000857 [Austropuccinia psidii MF-1]|uniref:Uncharacterized protein n=1 Tax=Austropuccinia psidii MF-1 TaxID=1389203 RepID=A0A9Q3GCG5_9BASI|nr:hypothetical protein [Austropuccinia psidii MF-1]
MQAELLALIKKEGKYKSARYTPQMSPLGEQTSLPRSFRPHGSPLPYPRPMVTSTPYTEEKQSNLPTIVSISFQIPTPLHQEILRNTSPKVRIRSKEYSMWFDGNAVEIFINRVENIAEIEGSSGRDISRKIAFWTKYEEISYHIDGIP